VNHRGERSHIYVARNPRSGVTWHLESCVREGCLGKRGSVWQAGSRRKEGHGGTRGGIAGRVNTMIQSNLCNPQQQHPV
jgi:hypothetical protein